MCIFYFNSINCVIHWWIINVVRYNSEDEHLTYIKAFKRNIICVTVGVQVIKKAKDQPETSSLLNSEELSSFYEIAVIYDRPSKVQRMDQREEKHLFETEENDP